MANETPPARRRKALQGRVVSDKMDKTVVVEVQTRRRHPLYHRVMRHISRFKAHDEANACRNGDLVRIQQTRPLSKTKRWRVVEIVTRGKGVAGPPEATKDGEQP